MNKRPLEEETDSVCSFFLERKKRPCRMKTQEGMPYCPHHSHLGSNQDSKKGSRIPCPYDSSHFCYESRLQKHLKKCNAREKEKPDYYVEHINTDVADSTECIKLGLADISDDELLNVIKKIKDLHKELNQSIRSVTVPHPLLQTKMEKSDDGFNAFKHMKQQATLLKVMESEQLLKEGTCFVEFGAGKGQLMYWIIKCVPENEIPAFVLVDRSAQRHKSDNKFKGSDIQIQRIRIDIQHLHLGKVDTIQERLHKVVGVSKHLCGAATDLALKCLMDTINYEKDGKAFRHQAFGLLMALCCHHRCSWNLYIGKQFLTSHHISEREFKIMCCIASWGTCGLRKTTTESTDSVEDIPDNLQENRYIKLNMSHEERTVIGMQCKRLIDAGRVSYLLEKGYNVELIQYTDVTVSLENVALLATHKTS